MKVLTLEVEGFGPYLARQTIDFTQFDDDIFLLTGKTGAGKSTILDAIVFALYDKVPRYDGTDKSVRSHFCAPSDPTEVTSVFEAGGQRYKVTRSPDFMRPKQRGDGLTKQAAAAHLWVERDGDWEAVAVRPVEVGAEIAAIMRLSADQFLQVVLLAQGRFQEFLQADTKERLAVLRSLFGTDRFQAIEQHLREVARERGRDVELADAGLSDLVARAAALVGSETPEPAQATAWWAEATAQVERTFTDAQEARAAAVTRADATAEALSQAKTVEDKRSRLERARGTLAELETVADEHAADVERLALARAAAPLVGAVRAARDAGQSLETARSTHQLACETAQADPALALAWPDGEIAAASEDSLRVAVEDVASRIGALTVALEAEDALPALRRQVESATTALADAQARHGDLIAEGKQLPAQIEALRERREKATAASARLDGAAAALKRAGDALDAHAKAAELEAALAKARAAEGEASAVHARAVADHNALLQRRLRSQAAHLAQALVPGEPCQVCGATEHPAPARPSQDHVTDDEVEAARESMEAARDVLAAATDAAQAVDRDLSAARAQAGDGDEEAAHAALMEAREAHDRASDAVAERAQLDQELAVLGGRAEALEAEVAAAAEGVSAAQVALAAATKDVTDAESLTDSVPEGYGSVREYADALAHARTLVQRVSSAAGAVDVAERGAREREAQESQALAESRFEIADQALEAALAPAVVAELAETVDQHRTRLSGAQAVVAELANEDLPGEVADLDALAAGSAAASQERDQAVAAEASAESVVTQVAAMRADYDLRAAATKEARAARDVALTLADSVAGDPPNERRMRLESFVLASKLERIVSAANQRLRTMSGGQYSLEHDDDRQYRNTQTGLGLRIADAHTGSSRSTRSLSGGETFLASLALALGLAETVSAEAGGVRLDTLFIDEGFGSLDGDTLEIAMSTLDELRAGGRTIGLISHVEAMKEQIPAKLDVVKAADGSSRVMTAGPATSRIRQQELSG
ncbi:SMC family ATPase [Demequina sp. B12]|uniref:AAA family ATPase n=1 Tax=Demequina sp. B12 TaxID=2992757 RepID=UPI00237A2E4D|nr:SMC family ATPase [Demequina sp. B12]MDE0573465.1 SMC family ATPase [Demequina sp. B12]